VAWPLVGVAHIVAMVSILLVFVRTVVLVGESIFCSAYYWFLLRVMFFVAVVTVASVVSTGPSPGVAPRMMSFSVATVAHAFRVWFLCECEQP
jgi:hypothetical protein